MLPKINKRLQNTNFTSDMIPYSLNYASGMISTETASGSVGGVKSDV